MQFVTVSFRPTCPQFDRLVNTLAGYDFDNRHVKKTDKTKVHMVELDGLRALVSLLRTQSNHQLSVMGERNPIVLNRLPAQFSRYAPSSRSVDGRRTPLPMEILSP